ncbi:MAG: outer membrane beta-barrel protein [Verrucomicrobiota bacterium]|nr:outer membrane beta-barrel protein [Verrucomicrobiota bacterium]
MKFNKWTLALAGVGLVSLASTAQAAEEQSQVMTALSSTTLSGYVDTSAIWKIDGPNGALFGRSFDGGDKVDGFNLHAVKLMLEKPLDEGQWSAGYKADFIFGPDANWYGTRLNGTAGATFADDVAVKQAYVALRAPVGNGLDIKMGVWDTIIGYEVFETGNNPNFSRSYGFALEPTHHTGVLLSYHVNDMISVSAGVANEWTGGINTRGSSDASKTYLGSLTLTLPESAGLFAGSAIYLGVVDGEVTGTAKDVTSYYLGTTLSTGVEGLSVGAAFDFRDDGAAIVTAGYAPTVALAADNEAWAAALYVSFQASEKLKLNARGEYTKGDDGTYYDAGTIALADKDNELGAVTLTADYSLWANVITRAEARWDHMFSGPGQFGGTDADRDALTLAANVIYKF